MQATAFSWMQPPRNDILVPPVVPLYRYTPVIFNLSSTKRCTLLAKGILTEEPCILVSWRFRVSWTHTPHCSVSQCNSCTDRVQTCIEFAFVPVRYWNRKCFAAELYIVVHLPSWWQDGFGQGFVPRSHRALTPANPLSSCDKIYALHTFFNSDDLNISQPPTTI